VCVCVESWCAYTERKREATAVCVVCVLMPVGVAVWLTFVRPFHRCVNACLDLCVVYV